MIELRGEIGSDFANFGHTYEPDGVRSEEVVRGILIDLSDRNWFNERLTKENKEKIYSGQRQTILADIEEAERRVRRLNKEDREAQTYEKILEYQKLKLD